MQDAQPTQGNPPLDHVAIHAMVEQRITEELVAFGNDRHTNSGTGGEGPEVNEKGA